MKKILALLMSCLLLVSMTCMVSAATGSTITVPKLTADDLQSDPEYGDWYSFAVALDKLYTTENTIANGYNSIEFKILFDTTKLEAYETPADSAYGVGSGWSYSEKEGKAWAANTKLSYSVSKIDGGLKVVSTSGSASKTMLPRNVGDGTLIMVDLIPVAGATGFAEVKIADVVFSTASELMHYDEDFTLVAGGVDLGGEEEGDDEPVATTVKTFAKRLYLDNTLYTVGVISEGTNFATETIKAGINIEKGDSTVNYWTTKELVSNNAGLSYYIVGLNDVTETTDITVNSKSKAIITVNGGDIIDANDAIGAEATDLEADIIKDAE